ncbi:MAG: DUF2087 domain-containing protein [Caldisericia bacterium]|nr:DUF2087 domain-containing protein [Caldisericia bacterium]
MIPHKTFFDASVEDIAQGYQYDPVEEKYGCLVCGKEFYKDEIYTIQDQLVIGKKAIVLHIEKEHGGMFSQLIELDKKVTGLTDPQKNILQLLHQGYSDKEIVEENPAIGSSSTVRSYRFKLREKEKQAKVFIALMKNAGLAKDFMAIHRTATMVDDRYMITEKEMDKVNKAYFTDEGCLIQWPVKEKKKLIVIKQFADLFETGVIYTEKEINTIIQTKFDDYALIRRYLVSYGFLDRKTDGSEYWKCKE